LSPALKQAAASYKIQLDSLAAKLNYAEADMDKWMEDFNMDSAKNDAALRAKYLEAEKEKVNRVREQMVSVLQQADSLLKK
jgi:hypothetical protein